MDIIGNFHLFFIGEVGVDYTKEIRAGIDPESEQTVQLVKAICGSATINFEGIYSHSGHSYNVKSSEEAAKVAEEERRIMIS